MKRRSIVYLLAWTCWCGIAKGEDAAPVIDADDPRVAQAKVACLASDPTLGLKLLAEIYAETGDPIWIFNQARCFEQNNQNEMALGRFREFLTKSNPQTAPDLVTRARESVARLEPTVHPPAPEPPPAKAPPVEIPPAPPRDEFGVLLISSEVGDANVWLDGQQVGLPPERLRVREGVHVVSVRAEDYLNWSQAVSLAGGQTLSVNASPVRPHGWHKHDGFFFRFMGTFGSCTYSPVGSIPSLPSPKNVRALGTEIFLGGSFSFFGWGIALHASAGIDFASDVLGDGEGVSLSPRLGIGGTAYFPFNSYVMVEGYPFAWVPYNEGLSGHGWGIAVAGGHELWVSSNGALGLGVRYLRVDSQLADPTAGSPSNEHAIAGSWVRAQGFAIVLSVTGN